MTINTQPERQSTFKERVKQEREQEILLAARDVFAERGFEKASIDDIAERVGIGKGTVYLHFASKEELLLELMRRTCNQLVATCRARLDEQPGAMDKVAVILRAVADHRYANESWIRTVAAELPAFIGYKQRLGASSELRGLLTQVIEEGQAEGCIDARIIPPMAALTLFFLIFVTPLADGKPMPKQQLIEAASQLYFHGISKEVVK